MDNKDIAEVSGLGSELLSLHIRVEEAMYKEPLDIEALEMLLQEVRDLRAKLEEPST